MIKTYSLLKKSKSPTKLKTLQIQSRLISLKSSLLFLKKKSSSNMMMLKSLVSNLLATRVKYKLPRIKKKRMTTGIQNSMFKVNLTQKSISLLPSPNICHVVLIKLDYMTLFSSTHSHAGAYKEYIRHSTSGTHRSYNFIKICHFANLYSYSALYYY